METTESQKGIARPRINLAAIPAKWSDVSAELADALGPMAIVGRELSVLPIVTDGTKRPAVASWKEFSHRRPNPLQVAQWIKWAYGYAIICGLISGGLEVLDFDDGGLYSPWYWSVQSVIERYQLPIVASPSGGFHVYWRCSEIAGSVKLAKSESGDTLIETRGEAGYILGPMNPRSVHPSGRLYLQIGGVDLPQVPTIQPDERLQLLQAASAFDRFGLREQAIREAAKRQQQAAWKSANPGQTDFRVGDDFKARATWPEVLEPHGWTYAGASFWTRPGGDSGSHSAAINQSREGTTVLTVFSSNAGPLAPTNSERKTWDLFSAYAALNHGGNRREAAKELKSKGFGQ